MKHIYILEQPDKETEAWMSLKQLLKALYLPHLYRSITYYFTKKNNVYVNGSLTIKRIYAEIKTVDFIYYKDYKFELKRKQHGTK